MAIPDTTDEHPPPRSKVCRRSGYISGHLSPQRLGFLMFLNGGGHTRTSTTASSTSTYKTTSDRRTESRFRRQKRKRIEDRGPEHLTLPAAVQLELLEHRAPER
jgi:hypothetical protein